MVETDVPKGGPTYHFTWWFSCFVRKRGLHPCRSGLFQKRICSNTRGENTDSYSPRSSNFGTHTKTSRRQQTSSWGHVPIFMAQSSNKFKNPAGRDLVLDIALCRSYTKMAPLGATISNKSYDQLYFNIEHPIYYCILLLDVLSWIDLRGAAILSRERNLGRVQSALSPDFTCDWSRQEDLLTYELRAYSLVGQTWLYVGRTRLYVGLTCTVWTCYGANPLAALVPINAFFVPISLADSLLKRVDCLRHALYNN